MRQLLAFSINYEIWFAKTEKWLWWKFGWIKLDFDIKQLIRNILAGTWTFSHMRMTDGNHSKFRFVFLLKMFQFSKDMQFLLEWKPTILLFLSDDAKWSKNDLTRRAHTIREFIAFEREINKICYPRNSVIKSLSHIETVKRRKTNAIYCHESNSLRHEQNFSLNYTLDVFVIARPSKKAPNFFPTTRFYTHTDTLSIKCIQRIRPISRIH